MNVTHRPLTDVAPYSGESEIPGIRFRGMRAALGVTAWGMNVIELDAHNEGYPAHDHTGDGQEEVYFVVDGSCTLLAGGETLLLRRGDFVRVPPEVHRKLVTGDEGVTVLAIGATPGQAYAPPTWG